MRRQAPSLARELLTLAGCLGHVIRRRCPAGLTMVAHSAGRLREGLRERRAARQWCARARERRTARGLPVGRERDRGGLDAIRRDAADEAVNAWELASGRRLRLELAARHEPPRRRVLVLGVERPERRALAEGVRAELLSSRHDVELHTCPPEGGGKFENLNRLLAAHPADGPRLAAGGRRRRRAAPRLPRPLPVPVRALLLQLAQPAHRLNSHAAWPQTRRRPRSVVRETSFVEIGPVTAFARATFPTLLPFPELRMGWGLDAHWAALAREHGWRCGVIDAVAIRHRAAPAADALLARGSPSPRRAPSWPSVPT